MLPNRKKTEVDVCPVLLVSDSLNLITLISVLFPPPSFLLKLCARLTAKVLIDLKEILLSVSRRLLLPRRPAPCVKCLKEEK